MNVQRGSAEMEQVRGDSFCTTTWAFPLWELDFEDNTPNDEHVGRPVLFKGYQFHLSGQVQPNYSGVIVPSSAGSGMVYQLELPVEKKTQGRKLFVDICNMFPIEEAL